MNPEPSPAYLPGSPEPYYADDLVTLYNADCRQVTAWLDADVLVTDPPYGVGYTGFGGRKGEPRRTTGGHAIAGDLSVVLRDQIVDLWGSRPALVFGTWRIGRPAATRQVIVWDKSLNGPGMGALDLPWGPSHEELYVLGSGFAGKREGSVYRHRPFTSSDAIRPDHPTPKPVALMESLIEKCPPGVIADPFAGSGATLLAARNLGRRSIGVEIEERYCDLIVRRLSQGALDFGGVA